MWRWSVEDLDGFWGALFEYFRIDCSASPTCVLARRSMPGVQWFPGARLNYAQHVLRREHNGGDAILFASETRPLAPVGWHDLGEQVRKLATRLRAAGVAPGDRVAAWMPNIPETMVAMLATTAIAAIWACCSADFDERGTLDRLAQLIDDASLASWAPVGISVYTSLKPGIRELLSGPQPRARPTPDRLVRPAALPKTHLTDYAIQGLWTAAQLRLPIAFVIVNNRRYEALIQFGHHFGLEANIGTALPNIDFCAIARGQGCLAIRVDRPGDLDDALRTAFTALQPTLVEVIVE